MSLPHFKPTAGAVGYSLSALRAWNVDGFPKALTISSCAALMDEARNLFP